MKALTSPAVVRHVLSFDFDGTLHDPVAVPPVPPEFFEHIARLREMHGAVWGGNTGRSMPQLVLGFIESRFPFVPDWVVAREREIWFPNHFGRWLAHEKWNKKCEKDIAKLFLPGICHWQEAPETAVGPDRWAGKGGTMPSPCRWRTEIFFPGSARPSFPRPSA